MTSGIEKDGTRLASGVQGRGARGARDKRSGYEKIKKSKFARDENVFERESGREDRPETAVQRSGPVCPATETGGAFHFCPYQYEVKKLFLQGLERVPQGSFCLWKFTRM